PDDPGTGRQEERVEVGLPVTAQRETVHVGLPRAAASGPSGSTSWVSLPDRGPLNVVIPDDPLPAVVAVVDRAAIAGIDDLVILEKQEVRTAEPAIPGPGIVPFPVP